MSTNTSEQLHPVEQETNTPGPRSLVESIPQVRRAFERLRLESPGGSSQEYTRVRGEIVEKIRKLRDRQIRSWGVAPRGELIIEGGTGANTESARSVEGQLEIESTTLSWERESLNLEDIKRDARAAGPVAVVYGGAVKQETFPLATKISVGGEVQGSAAGYYTKDTTGQPFAVEFSYVDPLGACKEEFVSSSRNGEYNRKERANTGEVVIAEQLGQDYDIGKEFNRLQVRVQESLDIRTLGGLAQQEYGVLANKDSTAQDYDKFAASLVDTLEDRKQATLEAIDEMQQRLTGVKGAGADGVRAQLTEFRSQAEAEIEARKKKVIERTTRTLSQFDEYKQQFISEKENRSGVLLSRGVVDVSRKHHKALQEYEQKIHSLTGQVDVKNVRAFLDSL